MKSSLKHDIKFIVSRNESFALYIYIYHIYIYIYVYIIYIYIYIYINISQLLYGCEYVYENKRRI